MSTDDIPAGLLERYRAGVGPDAPEGLLFDGGSHIVAPDGSWVVEPVYGQPGIITAALDIGVRYREVMDLDVTGHYARADVLQLSVDRRRLDTGVHFTEEAD